VCLKIEDSATLQHAMDKVLIHRRLAKADPDFTYFPCLYETFFVYERFISAEELLEGEHLWKIVERDPTYFRHLGRIQVQAGARIRETSGASQASARIAAALTVQQHPADRVTNVSECCFTGAGIGQDDA
jgi:hypothetical protein